MQKFSKRALALLASVMILVVAVAPNIGLVLGGSEEDVLRQNLITAWQNLEKTVTEPIAVPKEDNENRKAVAGGSFEGLDNPAALGEYYLKDVAVSNADQKIGYSLCVTSLDQYESVYVMSCSQDIRSRASLRYNWQSNDLGPELFGVEMKKGWTTFSVGKEALQDAKETILSQKQLWVWVQGESATTMNIGSIMGTYTFKPELPEGAAEMALSDLVTKAEALDMTGYPTDKAEAFNAALLAAKATLDPDTLLAQNLITAWQGLEKTAYDVVATPDGGADVPETVEGLTDASVLGTKYLDKQEYDGTAHSLLPYTFTDKWSLTKYDNYTVWFCAYKDGAESEMNLEWTTNYTGTHIARLTATGWTKFTVTNQTMNNVSHNGPFYFRQDWGDGTRNTALSMGSILGSYTFKPTLPEGYGTMTLSEIVREAGRLDLTGYTGAMTTAFNTALNEAQEALDAKDPAKQAAQKLLAAWQNLETTVTEPIAIPPESEYRHETADDTVLDGLAGANLGTHYAEYVPVGSDQIMQLPIKPVDLTQYTTLTFYMRGYDADKNPIRFKLWLQTATGGSNVDAFIGNQWGTDAWYNVKFNDAQKGSVTHIKFNFQNPDNSAVSGNPAYVSYGCVLGTRTQTAELPENAENLTPSELYKEAKKVNSAPYGENGAAFKTALEELATAIAATENEETVRDDLIEEWDNLKTSYTEVLAVPGESYTGNDEKTYERQEITDETDIKGLLDPKSIGTYYVDKIPLNAGWNQYAQLVMGVVKTEAVNFSRYSSIKVWVAGYDAEGNPTKVKINAQVNAGNSRWTEGTGWFGASIYNGDIIGNSIKVVCEEGANVAYFSLGCAMATWDERPDRPENYDALSFEELVAYAEKTDVSKFDATAFKAVLAQCRTMIDTRRKAVMDQWDALGLEKPDGIENGTITQIVDAALALDFTQTAEPLSSFGQAVWMLGKLTDRGLALDALYQAWKNVGTVPANYRLMTPANWVEQAEAVDLSEATDESKQAFTEALELVRNLLTQGKADVEQLKELVKNAKTMKSTDFAGESYTAFASALKVAEARLTNYEKTTQKEADSAKEDLLTAWGNLRVYKRTLWLNFLDYYTGVDPQASHSATDAVEEYGAVMKLTDVPNGATTGLTVKGQPCGWQPVNHSGIELENLKGYEYVEIYLRADAATFNGATLTMQWMAATGTNWYDVRYNLPADIATGEWKRIEIPLAKIRIHNMNGKTVEDPITENGEFKACTILVMIENGKTCDYEMSSFAAVKTEAVTAGVVPKVEPMKINQREEKPIVAPENPFKGVDRKDPWGEKEKEENRKNNNTTKDDVKKPSTSKVQVLASGTCGANLKWQLKDNGELIISGTGAMNDYDQQAPWNAYLGEIVTVTVKDGVTRIGNGALFGAPKLQMVTLPDSVTEIGETAFYECPSLKFMVVPGTVKTIGAYAIGLVYEASTNGAVPVSGFGVYGTTGSAAQKYAEEYGLEFFAIAQGEEEPAVEVESGTCGANVTWTFYSDGTLKISGTGDMDSYEDTTPWEAYLTQIKKVEIAEGVTGIGDSAFYGCRSLASVSIPESVKKIGNYAFYECYALLSAKVPASVKEVGGYAFGFVYDEAADDVALLPDFVLSVTKDSAALRYAESYKVPYDLYQDPNDDGQNTDNPTPGAQGGLAWWVWTLIALGGVVVLAGGTCLALVLVKRNKIVTAKTEVSDQ